MTSDSIKWKRSVMSTRPDLRWSAHAEIRWGSRHWSNATWRDKQTTERKNASTCRGIHGIKWQPILTNSIQFCPLLDSTQPLSALTTSPHSIVSVNISKLWTMLTSFCSDYRFFPLAKVKCEISPSDLIKYNSCSLILQNNRVGFTCKMEFRLYVFRSFSLLAFM